MTTPDPRSLAVLLPVAAVALADANVAFGKASEEKAFRHRRQALQVAHTLSRAR